MEACSEHETGNEPDDYHVLKEAYQHFGININRYIHISPLSDTHTVKERVCDTVTRDQRQKDTDDDKDTGYDR